MERSCQTPEPASKNLVTTEWLAERLGAPEITSRRRLVLPACAQARRQGGVPRGPHSGRGVLRHRRVADRSTDLPHMLPGAKQFSARRGKLGIGRDDTIVVYDGAGLGGAPRVWWTLRLFGARNVFILDGGLPKWKAEGRPVEAGEAKRAPRKFDADTRHVEGRHRPTSSCAMMQRSAQIVDARPAERFRGKRRSRGPA
jgi:thiosulfate/3-mercaptopyruvate sulfurtransferase